MTEELTNKNLPKLPLITCTWNESEIEAINKVIESDEYTMGDNVHLFEELFAKTVGSKYSVMVNSGSSANLLAVAALFYCQVDALKPGDEVIVPAVSWATTFSPLMQYGLKLKFIDINLETLNIDLDQLESAITDKTRVIFSVNLVGNPVDYIAMKRIIGDRKIWILEDNCESLGADINEKQAGTFGVMGTFSTYFSHHISTIEGGVIVTDDRDFYHILLSLRSHGWTRHLPEDTNICTKSDDPFYNIFDFILPGYNVRPTELTGAIGIQQVLKLPNIISGRKKNGKLFQKLFNNIQGIQIQKETGNSSWFGFALILDSKEKRDKLVKIFRDNNIECRPIVAGNFVKNPVIKYFQYAIHNELVNSDRIHDCGIYFGNHQVDISKQLAFIKNLVLTI